MLIQDHIESINSFLKEGFERSVFAAVVGNLNAQGSLLRINNFAYGARELITIILERLAPNDDVIKSPWFSEEPNMRPGLATRRQKVQYAIYGGLTEKYVDNLYGIDVDKVVSCITSQYEELSKYTHIRENTFGISDPENIVALEALSSLRNFFCNIYNAREAFSEQISISIKDIMYNEIADNHIDAFAHLAWNTCVDDVDINDVEIDDIDYGNVHCTVYGSADIELACGRSPGDSVEDTFLGYESCPFSVKATCSVIDLKDVVLEEFEMNTRY